MTGFSSRLLPLLALGLPGTVKFVHSAFFPALYAVGLERKHNHKNDGARVLFPMKLPVISYPVFPLVISFASYDER